MKKHLILTSGRSGSNYLVNLLNAHPQLTNYGEVLGDWTLPYKLHVKFGLGGKTVEAYLDCIYSSRSFFNTAHCYSVLAHLKAGKLPNFKFWNQVQSIGIKDFAMNFKKRNLGHFLQTHHDISVINLYRENQLKRFVSLQAMQESGVVSSAEIKANGKSKKTKVYLQPDKVLQHLEIFEAALNNQMDLIKELPQERVYNVRYEDLFESNQSQTNYRTQVFNFLGVDPIEVQSNHQKLLSNELVDIIANYEDLYSALKNTRFVKYFDVQV